MTTQHGTKRRMLRISHTKKALCTLTLASCCSLASIAGVGGVGHRSLVSLSPSVSVATFVSFQHQPRFAPRRQRTSMPSSIGPWLGKTGAKRAIMAGQYPLSISEKLLRHDGGGSRVGWTHIAQSQSTSLSHETESSQTTTTGNSENDTRSTTTTTTTTFDAAPEPFFDEKQFASFEHAIESIVAKRNVIRDFKKNEQDLVVVKAHLLDRKRVLLPHNTLRGILDHLLSPNELTKSSSSDSSSNKSNNSAAGGGGEQSSSSSTKQKLRERSEMYMEQTGLTPAQHKLAAVLLAHLADHCAKNKSPEPLHVAWGKILEAGLTPLSRTLSTYLYVLSLEEEVDDHGSDDDDLSSSSKEKRDIAAEVAMFHDALYEPTEKTITLLVKSLVGRGDAEGAEALLDGIADGPLGQLRHRTTSPILKLYCKKGEMDSALRLYHRMRTTSRVKMDAATYADFIAAVAEQGYFRADDSNCIVGAEDLGYSQSCGPELLGELIAQMAEDVMDISEESARVLHNGFAAGFKESGLDIVSDSDEKMKPLTTLRDNGALVANRVTIGKDTGKCPATGTTLRLIVLEESQRVHVHDTLIEMAREKSMEYTAKLAAKGRSTKDNAEKAEQATQILKEFSEWLDTREGKPYTSIVDGANIAYFGWGKVNIHQLIHMVDALEKQGEYPLVVFPQKYTRRKFHLRKGMMQVLKDEEMELLERLKEKDQMYVVPPMCLDDLCKCFLWKYDFRKRMYFFLA